MVSRPIRQGELYWVDLGAPSGSGPGLLHPHVVIQNDLFNQSLIHTVVVCALTSNLARSEAPGNVRLEEGEGGLPRASVVNVSQIFTVDKEDLVERIGTLGPIRLREVLAGIDLLLEPREVEEAHPTRRLGTAAGQVRMSGDFDEPLSDPDEHG